MLKHILFVIILVGGGYYFWTIKPIVHGPGEVAPNQPFQQRAYGVKSLEHQNYKFIPVAKLELEARILSKKKYYEDRETEFAPYDLVIGWGPMSDERNLSKIMVKQVDRSFYFEMIEPPIPIQKMHNNTAIMRLVVSDEGISQKIQDLRIGNIISVKGYLVNAQSNDGWSMKTSLIRNDTGREAAEIVWVKELSIM